MAHAVLGPSGADRWMLCPGSVALSMGQPDPSNDAADEGTAYHYLSAYCLENNLDAAQFVDREIIVWEHPESEADGAMFVEEFAIALDSEPLLVERHRYTVDVDNARYAQQYIDTVRAFAQDNLFFIEQTLPIDHLTDEENASGTGDAIVINVVEQEITIIDLKFGRGVEVTAEGNPQLQMYALGAVEKFMDLCDFKTARLVIHQPRSGDGRAQEWVIPIEDLLVFGAKVKRSAGSVWAALDMYQMFVDAGQDLPAAWVDDNLMPSEKGCRFCRARAKCPKIAEYISAVTKVDMAAPTTDGFDDLTEPKTQEEAVENIIQMDAKGNMTLSSGAVSSRKVYTLSQKMDAVPIIETWLKAVRAEVESTLLKGESVPGYKLVKGKMGNRQWSDDTIVEALLKKFRLKIEQKYNFALKSPAQLEKVITPKDKPTWWEKLGPMVTQAEGGLSVAPESDKRPAVSVVATDEGFEDLDGDLM